MSRLLVLAVCALLTAGCAGSDDRALPTTSQTQAEPERTPAPDTDTGPPRSYRELMARLPPFDEPASREVAAWRKATITASLDRCSSGTGGADRSSFVAANRAVLNDVAVFPGAAFVREDSLAERDGNGCPRGRGPATSYTTQRAYRLPAGTKPVDVLGHYEYALSGWLPFRVSQCEWRFTQGPGYVNVRACRRTLLLAAQGRAPVVTATPSVLPPRPFGAQYPAAPRYSAMPKATSNETKPGETCERVSGAEIPSIIVPPPPGISAEIEQHTIVVDWNLGRIHGDCPPSELVLGYPTATTHTVRVPVHAAAGVARMPLAESTRPPSKVVAVAVSVDRVASRRVAVLVDR